MPIANAPYVDPTRVSAGEQTDGLAWLPLMRSIDFGGFAAGEISASVTVDTYAGPGSWGDGSTPVGRRELHLSDGELRDLIRANWPHFKALVEAFEALVAARIGGVPVPLEKPPWVDAPMESAPAPATEE